MLAKDFKEFVQLLNENKVEYLLVGGYAVALHGYPRFTGDLDIWVNPANSNAIKVLNAVQQFGFSSYNLKADDFSKTNNVIQLGYPPLRIDILTDIDGVSFLECFQNKLEYIEDGITVFFISKNDLLKNKKASKRYKDLEDIEQLE
jgi:hypothetical protein